MSELPKATSTASFATAGVLTARLDFSWVRWSTPYPKSCRQSSLPVPRSKHSVSRDFLSFRCEVTNTLSPETTGELVPQPGNVTDQRTFSVLVHRIGRLRPSATPSAFGPLQHGQSIAGCWADAKDAEKTSVTTMIEVGFMNDLSAN